jgi:hypothetical protein
MIAFEVFINGQKRLTVGGQEYHHLNAELGLIRLPNPGKTAVTFAASGLTSAPVRVALWPTLELAVGDRVEVRVVDAASVDAPESVKLTENSKHKSTNEKEDQ